MDWSYVSGYFDGEGTARCKAAPSRPDYVLTMLSWANTHEESLRKIHEFIGCGYIQRRKKKSEEYTRGYELKVNRALDVIRVGEAMLPHLIIKHDKVKEIIEFVKQNRKPLPKNWGVLSSVGPDEIRRLYWEGGLNQDQIGRMCGCGGKAVNRYMKKHKIVGRPPGPVPKKKDAANTPSSDSEGSPEEET